MSCLRVQVPVATPPNFALRYEPPASKPGDYITFKAEMDCIMVFSACTNDVLPVNGTGKDKFEGEIVDCHYEIMGTRDYLRQPGYAGRIRLSDKL